MWNTVSYESVAQEPRNLGKTPVHSLHYTRGGRGGQQKTYSTSMLYRGGVNFFYITSNNSKHAKKKRLDTKNHKRNITSSLI